MTRYDRSRRVNPRRTCDANDDQVRKHDAESVKWVLSEFQERDLGLFLEPLEVLRALPRQPGDVHRGAVAHPKPQNLGRCAIQNTQTMKVFVLRDEYAAMSACQLPNGRITSPALAEETNVKGIGKEIAHCGYQLFVQLFVEEE